MNIYLIFVLTILVADYLLSLTVEYLNVKNIQTELPEEFIGFYDAQKYKQSQQYLRENTRVDLISETISTVVIISFILAGGFNFVDIIVRSFQFGPIGTGLLFAGILLLGAQILEIPFAVYDTFVIEEKYGFNKTTVKTFTLDLLKSWFLSVVIGVPILALVLWFFGVVGKSAWIYCWAALTILQLFFTFIAPVVIMPIFNKFTPLEKGELKTAIENFAAKENFKLKGIFKMDGSRRSTKSNAFFTGFGKYRRIVLFDTLIERHSTEQLVSVLAHEIGHYKKKHIFKQMLLSIFTSAIMFYILSLFINNPGLFAAFKMEHASIYASLVFFGFLFTPINVIFSVLGNYLSRHYEHEADVYAVSSYQNPQAMILALKKLSVDNLANLTPHPLKVFLQYSHPPILERINKIRKVK